MKYRSKISYARLISALRYEPETGMFFWLIKASRNTIIGTVAGCLAPDGYIKIKIDGVTYQAHRLAWLYMTGNWPKNEVDHKNLDKSDNSWGNLRPATHQQNMINAAAKKRKRGKTMKGAYKHHDCDRWFSRIRVNGKVIHLGMFDTEEEAHEAYVAAAPKYHGEFARVA